MPEFSPNIPVVPALTLCLSVDLFFKHIDYRSCSSLKCGSCHHRELSGVQEPMKSCTFCPMPETDIITPVLPNLKCLCCLLFLTSEL